MTLTLRTYKVTLAAIFIGLGCGVNTGNPGRGGGGGDPGGPKPTISLTTLSLDIKTIALGRLEFGVKSAELIPVGEAIDSAKAAKIIYELKEKVGTGSKAMLGLKIAIPAGKYDRLKLVLNDTKPLTFIDTANKEQAVKFDLTSIFTGNGSGSQAIQLPGGISIPNGAGTSLLADILNGSGTAFPWPQNSSGTTGASIDQIPGGSLVVPPVVTFQLGEKVLDILADESKLVELTADLTTNLEKRVYNEGALNEGFEYYFKPLITSLETKVTVEKPADVPAK